MAALVPRYPLSLGLVMVMIAALGVFVGVEQSNLGFLTFGVCYGGLGAAVIAVSLRRNRRRDTPSSAS